MNDNPLPPEIYAEMLKKHPPTRMPMDVHHAIFDKGLVKRMPLKVRKRIHDIRNLLWVLSVDNASHANVPSREVAYQRLCKREGKDAVDAYVSEMLGYFKSRPFTLSSLQGE